MAVFGVQTGIYCLGRINVAVAGTPAALNQNVPFVTQFGATAASAPTMRCNQLIFFAPGAGTGASGTNVTNAGKVYICYKGGNRSLANSIIADLAPGTSFTLGLGQNSPLDPSSFVIDADNNNDGCRVTAVSGT